jgi:hypothetical protein
MQEDGMSIFLSSSKYAGVACKQMGSQFCDVSQPGTVHVTSIEAAVYYANGGICLNLGTSTGEERNTYFKIKKNGCTILIMSILI